MSIPQPFPYQGSKRKLAEQILAHIPLGIHRIVEPFAGSGAISIASLYSGKVSTVLMNDINAPLMCLWNDIIHTPEVLADEYEMIWAEQFIMGTHYYYSIRDRFNHTHKTAYLLFLLIRCVKASVRYNMQGDFNQSPDNRRVGTKPLTLRNQLLHTSKILKGHTELRAKDYRDILDEITTNDLIYLDPPYQGTVGSRDSRYLGGIRFEEFVDVLKFLNERSILYIVSYDGRTGTKIHGNLLPQSLQLQHIELLAGRSSQATLLGFKSITYESLYLSPQLTNIPIQ